MTAPKPIRDPITGEVIWGAGWDEEVSWSMWAELRYVVGHHLSSLWRRVAGR